MKLAAARAIASVSPDEELHTEYIIPSVFHAHVAEAVAVAGAEAALRTGVARKLRSPA
jgi:malate dehydrogenase (oxaloacetate-decarboxylating)